MDFNQMREIVQELNVNTNFLTYAVLIGIMADFATGIAKGYKTDGKVSSSKLRSGGFKKAGMILVVFLSYGLSLLFNDTRHIIFNTIQIYYVYTESVSIIENLIELGVDVPWPLRKILGDKKHSLEEPEDEEYDHQI